MTVPVAQLSNPVSSTRGEYSNTFTRHFSFSHSPHSFRDHACRLLQKWPVVIQPLRVEVLAEVLAFDFNDSESLKSRSDWFVGASRIGTSGLCSSIITLLRRTIRGL